MSQTFPMQSVGGIIAPLSVKARGFEMAIKYRPVKRSGERLEQEINYPASLAIRAFCTAQCPRGVTDASQCGEVGCNLHPYARRLNKVAK